MRHEHDLMESIFLCGWLTFTVVSLLIVIVAGSMIDAHAEHEEAATYFTQLQYVGIGLVCLSAFICLPVGNFALKGRSVQFSMLVRYLTKDVLKCGDTCKQPTWSMLNACPVMM